MADYHNLLIRTTSRAEKEQGALDSILGDAVVDRIKQMEGRLPLAQAQIKGEAELTTEQRSLLPYVLAARNPCILCNEPPYVVSWWKVPEALVNSKRDQYVYFSLCGICKQLPGVLSLVTVELSRRVKGEARKCALVGV